jgi:hypothetical protein
MRRALKQLRTYLGRVFRDVGRQIAGNITATQSYAGGTNLELLLQLIAAPRTPAVQQLCAFPHPLTDKMVHSGCS